VSVVKKASALEPCHDAENLAILLARRADDELSRRADARLTERICRARDQAPGKLEIRQEVPAKSFSRARARTYAAPALRD